MGDPRDEDDEEAERKREVVRPERQQTGQQASFGPRPPMLKADFEDEQRNRNGKHAIAERLNAGGTFCQCGVRASPGKRGLDQLASLVMAGSLPFFEPWRLAA